MTKEIEPQTGDQVTVVGPGSPHHGELFQVVRVDRGRLKLRHCVSGKDYGFPRAGRFRFKVEHPPETVPNPALSNAVEEFESEPPAEDDEQAAPAPEADAPDQLPAAEAIEEARAAAERRATARAARRAEQGNERPAPLAPDLAVIEANVRAQIAELNGVLKGIELCRRALANSG